VGEGIAVVDSESVVEAGTEGEGGTIGDVKSMLDVVSKKSGVDTSGSAVGGEEVTTG
jgi:hypothetical protein